MRRGASRTGGILAGLVALSVLGLGLGQAFRDGTPPSLWVEGPDEVAAGRTFEVRVSADEPVRYVMVYGGERHEAVEQNVQVSFGAEPGSQAVRVRAEDGAGNVAEVRHEVVGVVVPKARLLTTEGLRPGDPFTVRVGFSPPDAPREMAELFVNGRSLPWHGDEDGMWALGAVPLATEAGVLSLRANWRDGLGRTRTVARDVRYAPLGHEVETLTISQEVLSVITPEGREAEERALAAVEADASDPPRWREPFVLPIEGRGTSGFARPRRYVPGGPVSFHVGEDIAADTGTEIVAPNDGLVVLADMFPIKGGLTVIDHGAGVSSRYYHQSRLLVEAGTTVRRGEVIGEVGSTGLSTGSHLHWEMRVDGVPTDPLRWVEEVRP